MLSTSDVLHLVAGTFVDLCEHKGISNINDVVTLEVAGPASMGSFLATYQVDEERKCLVMVVEKDELPDASPLIEQFLPVLNEALAPFLEDYPVPPGKLVVETSRTGRARVVYVGHLNHDAFDESDEDLELLRDCICSMFYQAAHGVITVLPAMQTVMQCGRSLTMFETMRVLTHAHCVLHILKTDELIESERGAKNLSDYTVIDFPTGLYGGISERMSTRN